MAGSLLNTLVADCLAWSMRGFETSVILTYDFLRRHGASLEDTAAADLPRAKIVDQHGQAHFIIVEPHATAMRSPPATPR